MDFSIIVPVLNEERHVAACVESLLTLDYPDDRYEIIVVDNGSTDRSAEIVQRYPGVRLERETQPGDFAARNRGVAASSGRFLAFTDADTAPDPDWLDSSARAFEDPGLDVIVGYIRLNDGGATVLGMMEAYEAMRGDVVFGGDDPALYYGFTCNQIVRRRAFDYVGPFPPVLRNSDTVFVQRVVHERGCPAVAYRRDVRVRRLEIGSFSDYLSKQHTYGRDYRRYETQAAVRTLLLFERVRLFRQVVRDEGYGPLRAALLLGSLAVGAGAYELGRLRGLARTEITS